MVNRKFSILVFLLFFSFYSKGQNSNSSLSNAYVPAGAFISFFGNHTFSNGDKSAKIIYTNRSTNPGTVNFVNKANWSGANDNSYVDGFVKVYNNDFFTFPIGDMGFYKPISISGAEGTSAAYFFEDVKLNQAIIESVNSRSNSVSNSTNIVPSANEYWVIKGDKPTQIIMHWNEDSDIKSIAKSVDDLKLVGWNGEDWEEIGSEVLEYALNIESSERSETSIESSLTSGSLISQSIIPNEYSIITFGSNNIESANHVVETQIIPSGLIDLTVFPNPINNLNNVKMDYLFDKSEGNAHVVIYDSRGQMIFKDKLKSEKGIYSIPLDMPVDQIYNVGIVTQKGSKRFGAVIVTGF